MANLHLELVDEAAYGFQQVCLSFFMDGDLKITAKNLDQLIDVKGDISVGKVHESSAPSLTLTALSS